MKIAVVTPLMQSGEKGGAENLYTGLVNALQSRGYAADQIQVLIDESNFDAILDSYARCYDLDLSRYDLVISTKAPTFMVRHPNHVSYLLHTIRVFYDMFEREFGTGTPDHHKQRRLIHQLDKQGLHPDRVKRHFANGSETFTRLFAADPFWRTVEFRALHHPPALQGFREPERGDYIFLPGRLHRWKRAQLLIEAYRHLQEDIPLKIAGTGEDVPMLRELAGNDPRIQFLGKVEDDALIDLYAHALVVPFVPLREDYGLITIEAFMSGKPVLTCTDSGEPTVFVRDHETGFVVEPEPRAIAERITDLAAHPDQAAAMGLRGRASIKHITWDNIVDALVSPGHAHAPRRVDAAAVASKELKHNVTVLDMQPIDPPVGGARQRLLGLYHALGENMPTTYIGTYDWQGEKYRELQHSPTLREITIPLTDAHFAEANAWKERAGKNLIDVAFDLHAHLSPDYLNAAREHAQSADIVIFSHPWIYPLVKDVLQSGAHYVVYDSHNVEGLLRMMLLDDGALGSQIVEHVVAVERELCHAADLVLTCSHQDRELFHEFYDVPYSKMTVVPNGTFTDPVEPASDTRHRALKQKLGLSNGTVAVFLGSLYEPNLQAAAFIAETVAPALPDVQFVLCGDVGEGLKDRALPPNVRLTGRLDEPTKRDYFAAADLALNPMFAGSGTNVKMFDFMAAGLPIATTPVGARGISTGAERAFEVASRDDFINTVHDLLQSPTAAHELGATARRVAEQRYSWERLSAQLGARLRRAVPKRHDPAPRFSVLIPTYERHASLPRVLEHLRAQTVRDFEVIVVDQSQTMWQGQGEYPDLDLHYIHTDIRGAVNARNVAAFNARGAILAFTDDDCQPLPDWLEKAAFYFDDQEVVGVEGLILSDKRNDPRYRAVTNEGFEGIGFMTANLLLRREIFVALDGFDERFDHPHFREDTDLGWRAMERGKFPFGRDVRVYHPPHPREVERESHAERNRFFEKDALLMAKHPERYRSLFFNEGHYLHTPGFREHLLRGVDKYAVQMDDLYRYLLDHAGGSRFTNEPPALRAAIQPARQWLTARPGETVYVNVRLVNRSTISFQVGGAPFALSYHLLNAVGTLLQFDNPRAFLPQPLAPGAEQWLSLAITAPHDKGVYRVELDLVWEGMWWFSKTGNPTSVIQLRVD